MVKLVHKCAICWLQGLDHTPLKDKRQKRVGVWEEDEKNRSSQWGQDWELALPHTPQTAANVHTDRICGWVGGWEVTFKSKCGVTVLQLGNFLFNHC